MTADELKALAKRAIQSDIAAAEMFLTWTSTYSSGVRTMEEIKKAMDQYDTGHARLAELDALRVVVSE